MVMIRKTKLIFIEAFIITVIVFGLGILLGLSLESSHSKTAEQNYINSEISLLDSLALNQFVNLNNQACPELIHANLVFADKIYEEAKQLEAYEKAAELTNDLLVIHRRYDLLRTFLWLNSMKVREKCGASFSVVVYVYEYKTKDLAKLADQELWESTLSDLKNNLGDKIVLIPVAGNSDITTLNILLSEKGINSTEDLPVVIINEKTVVKELQTMEKLKELIARS